MSSSFVSRIVMIDISNLLSGKCIPMFSPIICILHTNLSESASKFFPIQCMHNGKMFVLLLLILSISSATILEDENDVLSAIVVVSILFKHFLLISYFFQYFLNRIGFHILRDTLYL